MAWQNAEKARSLVRAAGRVKSGSLRNGCRGRRKALSATTVRLQPVYEAMIGGM